MGPPGASPGGRDEALLAVVFATMGPRAEAHGKRCEDRQDRGASRAHHRAIGLGRSSPASLGEAASSCASPEPLRDLLEHERVEQEAWDGVSHEIPLESVVLQPAEVTDLVGK